MCGVTILWLGGGGLGSIGYGETGTFLDGQWECDDAAAVGKGYILYDSLYRKCGEEEEPQRQEVN